MASGSAWSRRHVIRTTLHPATCSARSRARSDSKLARGAWKVQLSSSTIRLGVGHRQSGSNVLPLTSIVALT